MKTVTQKRQVGNTGETIAAAFLNTKGYKVLARNYQKPWGEIDIITRKGNTFHFVEVKSISRESKESVSQDTYDAYRPEENMHAKKIARIQRTIQSYLVEHKIEREWQLDLVAVTLYITDKRAECALIENVL